MYKRQLPDRPLDGINILSIIDGKTKQRSTTIKFWIASSGIQKGDKPYIDSELQEGTTPMLKIMDGKYTRSFKNFHHTDIQSQDFMGPRAVLDNRYKLVIQESDAGTVAVSYTHLDVYKRQRYVSVSQYMPNTVINKIVNEALYITAGANANTVAR